MKRPFVDLLPKKNEANIRVRVDLESTPSPSPSCNSPVEFNRTPLNSNSLAEKPRRGTKRRLEDDSLSEKSSSIGPNNAESSATKLRYEDLWFKEGGTKSKLCDESSLKVAFDVNKVNLIPKITTSKKVIYTEVESKIMPLETAFSDGGVEYFVKYSHQHEGVASSFVAKSIAPFQGVYPEILRQVYYKEDENSPVEVASNIITIKNPAYWGVLSDIEGHLKSINLKYLRDHCPQIQVNTVKAYYAEDGSVHYVPMLTDSLITPPGKAWCSRPGRDFSLVDISSDEQVIRSYLRPRVFSDYSECLTSDYVSKNIGMIFFFLEGPASFSIFFRVLIVSVRIWIECSWYIKLKLFYFFQKYKIFIVSFVLLFISFFIPISGVYLLY